MRLRSLVSEQNLLAGGGPGTSPSSASGLYAVLPARGSIIGLLSIEHGDAHHFTPRDVDLLAGFVEPAALAIDNARWFGRLRTVGADEERTRIARDLHDRIGQSLAYLAFELDRIVKNGADRRRQRDRRSTTSATDVRGVIREVRDTLYDLRTDVTETQSLVDDARGLPRPRQGAQRPRRAAPGPGDRPAADPAGAGALAHRPGGGHQRRAPRPRHPDHDHLALRRHRRAARGGRRRHRLPGGPGRAPRLLRPPRHARAGRQHRCHPRRRLRARPGTRVRCTLDAR